MPADKGYIYILTNPSFPQFVKIGYADNVQHRLAELNRSTAVPYAFRVYATYEVNSRLTDLKLHNVIEKLNPDLRTVENTDGHIRKREFFAMTPEDAYDLLAAMAEIHGTKDKLVLVEPTALERAQEADAKETAERAKAFSFDMCGILPGEQLECWANATSPSGKYVTVVDNKRVEYEGQTMSLTAAVQIILDKPGIHLPGPSYFKYKGDWINDIRSKNGY